MNTDKAQHDPAAPTPTAASRDPATIPVTLVRRNNRVGVVVKLEWGDGFPMPIDSAKDAVNRTYAAMSAAGGVFGFMTDYERRQQPSDGVWYLFAFRDQLNHTPIRANQR